MKDPSSPASGQATLLLSEMRRGNQRAAGELMPIVYEELRRLARHYLKSERKGHTLQSTALVHEAYLRLIGQDIDWKSRAHFIGVAANMMRRLLIDHARAHRSAKRGGAAERVPLLDRDVFSLTHQQREELLSIDEALDQLAALDADQAKVVEMRFFGGLSEEEIAEALGLSPRTVRRYWKVARAWLRTRLGEGSWDDAGGMEEA